MKVADLWMGDRFGTRRRCLAIRGAQFFRHGDLETRGEETDCSGAGDDSFWGDRGQDLFLINLAVQSVSPVSQSVKIRAAFFLGWSCSLTATSHGQVGWMPRLPAGRQGRRGR